MLARDCLYLISTSKNTYCYRDKLLFLALIITNCSHTSDLTVLHAMRCFIKILIDSSPKRDLNMRLRKPLVVSSLLLIIRTASSLQARR